MIGSVKENNRDPKRTRKETLLENLQEDTKRTGKGKK